MIFEKQVVNAYKGMMHTRCDDIETVYYFSAEDFDGLQREAYAFPSSMGHMLKGYFYCYRAPIEGRLIIFDHGFGGGHRAYMKEIELLCRHGYRVFAYDHTGCMESGGVSPNGLAQSLRDLDDCVKAIKADPRLAGVELSVMGHSWGGFSTMNIAALHPEITRIVALCGFVSVEEMIKTFFGGFLRGYCGAVLSLERACNPDYASFNAVESLASSNVQALLIYSANDALCSRVHYEILRAGLKEKNTVKFMLEKKKGHNPNYTEDAVKLLGEFGKARGRLARKKNLTAEEKQRFVSSFDWERMTAQDEAVWQEIFAHLDGER
ncbi:MAG: alpha/beta fold hydrolase [Ruminococcaceae bacterium]|nr:alpha/beta fold hydrolase [Oscillospiraceae bacterium]